MHNKLYTLTLVFSLILRRVKACESWLNLLVVFTGLECVVLGCFWRVSINGELVRCSCSMKFGSITLRELWYNMLSGRLPFRVGFKSLAHLSSGDAAVLAVWTLSPSWLGVIFTRTQQFPDSLALLLLRGTSFASFILLCLRITKLMYTLNYNALIPVFKLLYYLGPLTLATVLQIGYTTSL